MNKYIGDTDNDGFGEWVSGSHDFSHGGFFFKVFEADGDNQYHEIYCDSLPGNPWLLGGIDVGDVDGDEIPEFVFSSNFDVALYQYSPSSNWHRAWLLDSLQGSVSPYLVDCDGDSLNEIAIATSHIPNYSRIYNLVQTRLASRDIGLLNSIEVSPNPANSSITIQLAGLEQGSVLFSIYDILGREIYTDFIYRSGSAFTWNLKGNNGEEVSSGVYFIRIKASEFENFRKITILK